MASAEELKIAVRMKDFASKEFKRLGKTIKGFASKAMGSIKKLVKSAFSLKGVLVATGLAFGAMKLVDHAAQIEGISGAYENLMKSVGGAEDVLQGLRRATKDTVSDFELMKVANQTVLLGVAKSADEFEELATIARRLGRAVGRNTLDAFNDLATGIGRQSKLILDNLGLIVKVGEANAAYARALGKTVGELTDVEKKQAFLNATMDAARSKVAELGADTDTLSDSWGQVKAMFANIANELLISVTPAIKDLFEEIMSNKPALLGFAADMVEGMGEHLAGRRETGRLPGP